MERSEVSRHEVAVYHALRDAAGQWLTSKDITERAKVAPRTARAHALKLVQAGLVDQAEVFPGHRYRIAERARERNRGYYDRLQRAAEVLGIS